MKKKRIVAAAIAVFFAIGLTGCALFDKKNNHASPLLQAWVSGSTIYYSVNSIISSILQ